MINKDLIYLDYASTHPRLEDIVHATADFSLHHYANVGRGRYALAEDAEIHYAGSKKLVAKWLDCQPLEVLYTYSATYAFNLLALALEHNKVIQTGDTILLSLSEHHANIVPWQMLAKRVGAQVKFVPLDQDYRIDLDALRSMLDDSVKVVSLQYASNVTGAIHPLEEVREIIGDRLFFIDAAQMGIHGGISFEKLGADALVLAGHKMMADTGIGVLALRRELQKSWQAPMSGGSAINFVRTDGYEQAGIPERWEPGTPHITGAFSLGAAVEYLLHMSEETFRNYAELIAFTNMSFAQISVEKIQLFHSQTEHEIGIWSFAIPGKHPNDISDAFAMEGICVRSGHHCCEPLHDALGVQGTVRISIGYQTTREEIESFFQILTTLL